MALRVWPLRPRQEKIKKESGDKNKMHTRNNNFRRNQTFTTRRNSSSMPQTTTSWVRNQNTIRHAAKPLGAISHALIVGLLVLIVSLIYVAQGTRATNYDYEISEIDQEITSLQTKKDDLAAEKARLTSVAATSSSEVASNMNDANVSGYAQE